MSAYVSNTRPSILKQILHKLGIIDLPVKVNCWFCNQDSFLLPGTRNTPDHWNCHLCDNTNARDPATGEILDPSPFQTAQIPENTSIKRSTNYMSNNKNNSRSICDGCIQNQALIYDILSKYIPDETDPTYQQKCDNVEDEKRRLQNVYKLCDSCQSLVDMVVREQMELLNIRSLGRTFSSSADLDRPLPKRPSALLYGSQKIIWFITHCATLLFIIHELYRPSNWIVSDVVDDWKKSYLILTADNNNTFSLETLSQFSPSNTTILMLCIFILTMISLRGLYIHPLVGRLEVDDVVSWDVYKSTQQILFVLRYLSIFSIILQGRTIYVKTSLTLYIILLVGSLFTVKRKNVVKMRAIGSSTSRSVFLEEEEEESDVSAMDIDEPLSVVAHDDPVESLVFRLRSL